MSHQKAQRNLLGSPTNGTTRSSVTSWSLVSPAAQFAVGPLNELRNPATRESWAVPLRLSAASICSAVMLISPLPTGRRLRDPAPVEIASIQVIHQIG